MTRYVLMFYMVRGFNTSPYHQPIWPPAAGIPRLLIHYSLSYLQYGVSLPFICKPGSSDVVMTGHVDH
jgi:hypothetical protein